jgi:mRNA interferase MazF
MTPFRPGDIVAVEFPFSDLQTYKRRPGLVLLADETDLLLARLTTHPPRDPTDVPLKFWSEIGLPRASTVRLRKLATIDRRLIHHKIGQLRPDDSRAVAQAWQNMANAFAVGSLQR